jgi:general secretion pathway protein F
VAAFEFQALDAAGKNQKGVLEGDTAKAVRALLRERGWTPLDVALLQAAGASQVAARGDLDARAAGKADSQITSPNPRGWFTRHMGRAELAIFTQQFATLVNAGLPLDEVLSVLAEQSEGAHSQRMIIGVRAKMLEGQSLSQSLAQFPHSFDRLYCASIKAGEQSGQLHTVLTRLADYCEASAGMTQKVLLALIYPALLLAVCIAVVTGLLSYVVPQLLGMFNQLGGELPMATQVLLALSGFITRFGVWIALALVLAAVAFAIALRQPIFRTAWHAFLLRLPILGPLLRAGETARFARTLAIASSASVPVLEALRLSQEVLSFLPIRKALIDATARVREGQSLASSLKASKQFPELLTRLIGSGERSGKLEPMLEHGANLLERRVQSSLSSIMALLEPGMILVMGTLVLGIVMAILQPIFMMNGLIAQ